MSKFPAHRPRQIELILQQKKTDCGVACLAMIAGKLYDDIIKVYPELKSVRGMYPEEIFNILEDMNYDYKTINKLPKGIALVTIQWNDKKLSGHYVIWDNKRKQFLDPLNGVINKRDMLKFAEIENIWKVWRSK